MSCHDTAARQHIFSNKPCLYLNRLCWSGSESWLKNAKWVVAVVKNVPDLLLCIRPVQLWDNWGETKSIVYTSFNIKLCRPALRDDSGDVWKKESLMWWYETKKGDTKSYERSRCTPGEWKGKVICIISVEMKHCLEIVFSPPLLLALVVFVSRPSVFILSVEWDFISTIFFHSTSDKCASVVNCIELTTWVKWIRPWLSLWRRSLLSLSVSLPWTRFHFYLLCRV